MSDAELIERARESISRLMNYSQCHDGDVDGAACLLEQLADRLTALTTPEPWRSPSEPPPILERVLVLVGSPALRMLAHVAVNKSGAAEFYRSDSSRVEIGYHTRGYSCGWADNEGRRLEGVAGWKPIRRPEP